MLDLVENSEDRFSHDTTQLIIILFTFTIDILLPLKTVIYEKHRECHNKIKLPILYSIKRKPFGTETTKLQLIENQLSLPPLR